MVDSVGKSRHDVPASIKSEEQHTHNVVFRSLPPTLCLANTGRLCIHGHGHSDTHTHTHTMTLALQDTAFQTAALNNY